MKRVIFFLIFLMLAILGFSQVLTTKRGSNRKYGSVDKTGKVVIPFKYDYIYEFSDGLARVSLNGKWGYIDRKGKEVIPIKYDTISEFSYGIAKGQLGRGYNNWGFIDKKDSIVVPFKYKHDVKFPKANVEVDLPLYGTIISAHRDEKAPYSTFSGYAKKYVEEKINEWQKKGRYETTPEWQIRVNESARKYKVDELINQARKEFIAFKSKDIKLEFSIEDYDADNGVFLIKTNLNDLLVPVPRDEAPLFEQSWANNITIITPKYTIENDNLALAEVSLKMPNGKNYQYSNKASLNYSVVQIDYNFDPINIDISAGETVTKGKQNIRTVNIQAGTKSDVALNIPIANIRQDKTFAVIISNENYRKESQVLYANNDGAVFKEYCVKTLGIPEKNIHHISDATLNDIRGEINWISNVSKAYAGEVKIIFYYAGHGVPEESSMSAYLLPIDGYGSDVTTGYKLDDLYLKLGSLPAKTIIVFMDACFSGTMRSGDMLASTRGVAIKVTSGKPSGNMVVFTASQGDETAYPYNEKGHGLFTYFLLKKLQETKGDVTLGELNNYITTNVKQQSIVVNNKIQTPTVTPSSSLVNWEKLKLK